MRELVAGVSESLAKNGIVSANADAIQLVAFALNIPESDVRLKMALTDAPIIVTEVLEQVIDRRIAGEPLQHILGKAYFYGYEFKVGLGVFIPRPETEVLVSEVFTSIKEKLTKNDKNEKVYRYTLSTETHLKILDLCAGSGAIGLSLGLTLQKAGYLSEVTLVEKSPQAYAYLQENVIKYQRIAWGVKMFTAILQTFEDFAPNEHYDIIVCNPPYVPGGIDLPREVSADPEMALYGGGADGFDLPRAIITKATGLLKPDGLLMLEHFEEQAEDAHKAFENAGFSGVQSVNDLTGRARFTRGVRKK